MVEAGTLCINADVVKKAGVSVSAASIAEAFTNVYILMAEAQICTAARFDWVANYADVSTIGKEILRDACSSFAAIKAINYDIRDFPTAQHALTTINVLWAEFQKVIALLEKDNNYKDFILTAVGSVD